MKIRGKGQEINNIAVGAQKGVENKKFKEYV